MHLIGRLVGMGEVRLNTAVLQGVIVLRDVHRPREPQRPQRELARAAS